MAATFVVRVWLPDRPGAFGAVASRIGAVRGDLVGIDILERGAGRAIDELVVELPDAGLVPLLVQEIHEVDGVDVEEVRAVVDGVRPDPRVAALETAAMLTEQPTAKAVLGVLVDRALEEFGATWVVVLDPEVSRAVAAAGEPPPLPWVLAFAGGVASSVGAEGDVSWASLTAAGLTLVVGRAGRPVREVESRQLAALARVADVRVVELGRRSSASLHPSAVV